MISEIHVRLRAEANGIFRVRDQPTGFTMPLAMARGFTSCREGHCSLNVRVAYPDVEGSTECYTLYFPRLIDSKGTFRSD